MAFKKFQLTYNNVISAPKFCACQPTSYAPDKVTKTSSTITYNNYCGQVHHGITTKKIFMCMIICSTRMSTTNIIKNTSTISIKIPKKAAGVHLHDLWKCVDSTNQTAGERKEITLMWQSKLILKVSPASAETMLHLMLLICLKLRTLESTHNTPTIHTYIHT